MKSQDPDTFAEARAPTSHMETQVAEQQQQWHVNIGLTDFVAHVSNLQHVVDVCNTTELGSIDRAKLKNIMQWGLFVEQVNTKLGYSSCWVPMNSRSDLYPR